MEGKGNAEKRRGMDKAVKYHGGVEMDSKEGSRHWNVFNGVRSIPATSEALMAEINTAISGLEYTRATALLQNIPKGKSVSSSSSSSQYDARVADEAYKAGLASLEVGKVDDAIRCLNMALSRCPPNKTMAIAKLQSLISLSEQHLHNKSSK